VIELKFVIVWLACIQSIWRARNQVIFHDKGVSIEAILEQSKMLPWNWLQAKANSCIHSISQWFTCLGLVCNGRVFWNTTVFFPASLGIYGGCF
jgi:hypothetical protein